MKNLPYFRTGKPNKMIGFGESISKSAFGVILMLKLSNYRV